MKMMKKCEEVDVEMENHGEPISYRTDLRGLSTPIETTTGVGIMFLQGKNYVS